VQSGRTTQPSSPQPDNGRPRRNPLARRSRWSWKIGTLAGIDIRVHAAFLLIIVWIVGLYRMRGESLVSTLEGVGFVLALFGCVVLHELGHALMAKRFGVRTRDITLLPIGGVASLERIPEDPRQELLIAVAGPAVNVVLAVVFFGAAAGAGAVVPLEAMTVTGGPFLERLALMNVVLAVFNMVPAFPMDGGRVVRALMVRPLGYVRATEVASLIGRLFAVGFAILGIYGNPVLLVIAAFIWLAGGQETNFVRMRAATAGHIVDDGMLTDFAVLEPHDPLARAVQLLLAGSQQDFPVAFEHVPLGVLTRDLLLKGIARHGDAAPVERVMRKDAPLLAVATPLAQALTVLQTSDLPLMIVDTEGDLVGLLTQENLAEFVATKAAREAHAAAG